MRNLNLKGKCLCGSIVFKTSGNHRDVINCHCVQCLKTNGNYVAATKVLENDIKFLKKTTLRWYRSSKRAKRGFCSKCGASIFFKILNTNTISIFAGIFDKPTKLKTTMDIFVEEKSDYYRLNKKNKIYKKLPKELIS